MQWEYMTATVDSCGYYLAQRGDDLAAIGNSFDRMRHVQSDDYKPSRWEHINALGDQGWELVAVSFQDGSQATAFFKRQK